MATVVAQPQTSRAGLITTIVISLMLNILLAVVYFRQYNDYTVLDKKFTDFTKKYADAVSESTLNLPDYVTAKEQAKAAGNLTVYDLLSNQRNDLATAIIGTPLASPEVRDRADQARKEANAALEDYGKKVDLTVAPGNSLVETLSRWPSVVKKAIEQREQLTKEVQAADEKQKALRRAPPTPPISRPWPTRTRRSPTPRQRPPRRTIKSPSFNRSRPKP
jgi:hypothetical protein